MARVIPMEGGSEGPASPPRRRRGVPGLQALSGRVAEDLSALAHNVRALPEAVEYLRRLADAIDGIADDTARMREATEHMDAEVVKLHEKFEAVEASVGDLARALRPIRSRRRAKERAANGQEKGDGAAESDVEQAPPTPEGA